MPHTGAQITWGTLPPPASTQEQASPTERHAHTAARGACHRSTPGQQAGQTNIALVDRRHSCPRRPNRKQPAVCHMLLPTGGQAPNKPPKLAQARPLPTFAGVHLHCFALRLKASLTTSCPRPDVDVCHAGRNHSSPGVLEQLQGGWRTMSGNCGLGALQRQRGPTY